MRRSILLTISGMFVAATAHAAGPALRSVLSPIPDDGNPYFSLGTPVSEDGKTVREFFQFSCPYCREMHPTIWNWGSSLPRSLIFEPTPIVTNDVGSVLAASAFYTVYIVAPEKLSRYCDAVYRRIQDQGLKIQDAQVYVLAARDVKIPLQTFRATIKSERIAGLVDRAARLVARYQIINTPTISVGGKYTVNPEIVDGDPRKFVQLANAVTNKHLQGL